MNLDRFDEDKDTTGSTIETMTELTDRTDTGFQPDSLGAPPATTNEETTVETGKKKSKIVPILAAAGLGILALGGGAFMLASGGSGQQPQPEPTGVENIPTIENSASDVYQETTTASDIMASDTVASDVNKNTVLASDVHNGVEIKTETSLTSSQPSVINNLQASSTETQKSNDFLDNKPTINKDENKTIPVTTVTDEVIKDTVSQINTGDTVSKPISSAEALREEAKKMLAKADSLEKQSKLDIELAGKTLEEQVAYLKEKLVATENEIKNRNVCVAPSQKKNNVTSKTKKSTNTAKKQERKPSQTYKVTGIVEGQIWVSEGDNKSRTYVVGDKLPSGATIKNISVDKKTITTTNGTFKVN